MSWTYGNKIKITIFGQSHSDFIGISIDGISAGVDPQTLEISDFLKRRSTSFAKNCSNRKEDDEPIILSGLADGKTCGAPLCVVFKNRDIKKSDYDNLIYAPRPSHADFTAYEKYSGFNDKSGGGQFSGRLTLPFCYAGGFFKSLLKSKGIIIGSKLIAVGKAKDSPFLTKITEKELIDYKIPQNMIDEVNIAAENGDSVGGIIQCCILGMPVGVGEPFFDSIESKLAALTFSIPAVKGIEFGAGFGGAAMRGS
ncbi:MAG: chorismate synthase, partial [Clostridia bacterium]